MQQVFQDKIHIRYRIGDQKSEHNGIEAQQNCSLVIGNMNQLDIVPLDSPDNIGCFFIEFFIFLSVIARNDFGHNEKIGRFCYVVIRQRLLE